MSNLRKVHMLHYRNGDHTQVPDGTDWKPYINNQLHRPESVQIVKVMEIDIESGKEEIVWKESTP